MSIADHLDENTKKAMYKMASKEKQKKPPPKNENYSFKDWERMMGKYDSTYERKNGAIRRK